MSKNVLIVFGGISSEHEVSIISGLQILENINKEEYTPIPLYINKDGEFLLIPNLKNRKGFLKEKRYACKISKDGKGAYIEYGYLNKKIYIYSAYLALHGGTGEGGQLQGLLETYDIPFTSTNTESSILCMNKAITKEILSNYDILMIESISFKDYEYLEDQNRIIKDIKDKIGFPVIIKPVHLGSSIGISIANNEIELKKYISSSVLIDNEIMVEEFLDNIEEFNISLRKINNVIECSEIERPIQKSKILSFEDKYADGGKKTGGMESLSRELPAKISESLKSEIINTAIKIFSALRCSQMVRIDFIYSNKNLYLCEVNQIPGSMAFYLWEANGITFRDQISDLIEESLRRRDQILKKRFSYSTDIVEKFVSI